MKLRGRVDANQPEIVRALRDIGASVVSLANVGQGCGDILVGYKTFERQNEYNQHANHKSLSKLWK